MPRRIVEAIGLDGEPTLVNRDEGDWHQLAPDDGSARGPAWERYQLDKPYPPLDCTHLYRDPKGRWFACGDFGGDLGREANLRHRRRDFVEIDREAARMLCLRARIKPPLRRRPSGMPVSSCRTTTISASRMRPIATTSAWPATSAWRLWSGSSATRAREARSDDGSSPKVLDLNRRQGRQAGRPFNLQQWRVEDHLQRVRWTIRPPRKTSARLPNEWLVVLIAGQLRMVLSCRRSSTEPGAQLKTVGKDGKARRKPARKPKDDPSPDPEPAA